MQGCRAGVGSEMLCLTKWRPEELGSQSGRVIPEWGNELSDITTGSSVGSESERSFTASAEQFCTNTEYSL